MAKKIIYADDLKEVLKANYSKTRAAVFCDCIDAAPDVSEEVQAANAAALDRFMRAAYEAGKEGKPLMVALNENQQIESGERFVSLREVNRILNRWKSPRYRDIDGDWVGPYIDGCVIKKINDLLAIEIREFLAVDVVALNEEEASE